MSRSAIDVGDPLGHLPAELGEVVAVAAAVEHAVGLCTSPCRSRCTIVSGVGSCGLLRARLGGGGGAGGGGQGVEHGLRRRGRRGRRRRTTPRTPTAAGRRRASSIAWKNAAYAAASCAEAPAKSRHRRPSVKNTENMVPAACTTCGTPAVGQRVGDRGLDGVGGRRRGGRRPRRWPAAAWPGRRWWRPGSRTACRPGRPGPSGASGAITSARPPNAAAGKPPPITLPNVIRSGRQPSTAPSRPHWPGRVARKPVITSSLTNSAPWARQVSARKRVEARLAAGRRPCCRAPPR